MAAKALYPALANAQDAFATIAEQLLPTGVRGWCWPPRCPR